MWVDDSWFRASTCELSLGLLPLGLRLGRLLLPRLRRTLRPGALGRLLLARIRRTRRLRRLGRAWPLPSLLPLGRLRLALRGLAVLRLRLRRRGRCLLAGRRRDAVACLAWGCMAAWGCMGAWGLPRSTVHARARLAYLLVPRHHERDDEAHLRRGTVHTRSRGARAPAHTQARGQGRAHTVKHVAATWRTSLTRSSRLCAFSIASQSSSSSPSSTADSRSYAC